MWIVLAFASSVFAALTTILAKCGIKKTDSTVATAIRTCVVVIFAWIMVLIVGSYGGISDVKPKSWIFLILSGFATGASWLCYFKALQLGDVNKVVAVDKSSVVFSLLLAFVILGEPFSALSGLAVILITAGTYLMVDWKKSEGAGTGKNFQWLLYGLGSAVFASLTSILGKIGIENVESNLGTAVRTVVVLIFSWVMVFVSGKKKEVRGIEKRELIFIVLSGFATGGSWLCYFKALQDGLASVVVPVDKMSILFVVIASAVIFKEKISGRAVVGLLCIVAGTFLMIVA